MSDVILEIGNAIVGAIKKFAEWLKSLFVPRETSSEDTI